MSNRPPRRQGVVYGLVRPPQAGRDRGAILGRILGVLVLLMAVGVLGGGAIALINGRPAGASPSPVAQLTTTPTAGSSGVPASTQPSSAPSPSASASASAPPSSSPTPFVPQVEVGPGFVTFGTKADAQLHISDPQGSLAIADRLTWSAFLLEPADSIDLVVRIFKLDPAAEGGERLVREEQIDPAVRDAQLFLRRMRPARLLDGPGVYIVRYLRADELLAEGYVLLEG